MFNILKKPDSHRSGRWRRHKRRKNAHRLDFLIPSIWEESILTSLYQSVAYPGLIVGMSKHKKRRAVRHLGKSLEAPKDGNGPIPGLGSGTTIHFNVWKPKEG